MTARITQVSQRALASALKGDMQSAAREMEGLGDGQLDDLAFACRRLADAATAERNRRAAR